MITVGFQLVSIDLAEVRGIGRDGVGEIPVRDGGSLADAMAMIGLPPRQPFQTMVNGEPVTPGERAGRTLLDGDQVVVFPPAGR